MSAIRPGPNALVGPGVTQKVIRRHGRPEDNLLRHLVDPLFRAAGIDTFFTSARNKARGVTPGIADMLCFFPRLGFRFDFEGKMPGQRQSHEQLRYQEACIACGHPYVLGDLTSAEDFLIWLGIVRELPVKHSFGNGRIIQHVEPKHWGGAILMRAEAAGMNWHTTDAAKAHQERFGWKPTAGALVKVGRRGKR